MTKHYQMEGATGQMFGEILFTLLEKFFMYSKHYSVEFFVLVKQYSLKHVQNEKKP